MLEHIVKAAITIVVAILLAIGLIYMAEGQAPPPLQHSDYDDQLDRLDKRAIEQAYVAHVAQLFRTWMTDYSTNPTPFRALTGHRNARQGYIDTVTAIDQRK